MMVELKKEYNGAMKEVLSEISRKLDNLSIQGRDQLSSEIEDKIPLLEGAIKIHQKNYTELLRKVNMLEEEIRSMKDKTLKPGFLNSTNMPVMDQPKDLDHYFDKEEDSIQLPKKLSL